MEGEKIFNNPEKPLIQEKTFTPDHNVDPKHLNRREDPTKKAEAWNKILKTIPENVRNELGNNRYSNSDNSFSMTGLDFIKNIYYGNQDNSTSQEKAAYEKSKPFADQILKSNPALREGIIKMLGKNNTETGEQLLTHYLNGISEQDIDNLLTAAPLNTETFVSPPASDTENIPPSSDNQSVEGKTIPDMPPLTTEEKQELDKKQKNTKESDNNYRSRINKTKLKEALIAYVGNPILVMITLYLIMQGFYAKTVDQALGGK